MSAFFRVREHKLKADGKPIALGSALGPLPSRQGVRLLLLSSTLALPPELTHDDAPTSPGRLLVPGSDDARQLAAVPFDLDPCPFYLRIVPRHTPEAVTADQTPPTTAAHGLPTHDLDTLRIWAGGGGTAALRVWAFNGAFWVPHLGPLPVPAEGIEVDLDLKGRHLLRIATQLTGVSGTVSLHTSLSAEPTDIASLTWQIWS